MQVVPEGGIIYNTDQLTASNVAEAEAAPREPLSAPTETVQRVVANLVEGEASTSYNPAQAMMAALKHFGDLQMNGNMIHVTNTIAIRFEASIGEGDKNREGIEKSVQELELNVIRFCCEVLFENKEFKDENAYRRMSREELINELVKYFEDEKVYKQERIGSHLDVTMA